MTRTLLLDMDGTMLDSERMMLEIYAETARGHGFKIDRSVAESTVGTTYRRTAEILLEAYPGLPNDAILRDMGPAYLELLDRGGVPVKPGLFELLNAAAARRIPVGVCSSSHRETVERALRGCGALPYISHMVCSGEAPRSKPHPEPYLLLAERMNTPPRECLAVEDSPHGAQAALAAHIGRVCVIPDIVPIPQDLLPHVTATATLSDIVGLL